MTAKDPEAEALQARIYEIRRARLRQLSEQFDSVKAFADALGEDLNYFSRLVKLQKNGRKNLGEAKARRIEAKLGLPIGWLDQATEDHKFQLPERTNPWPFNFNPAIWEGLTLSERRRAEDLLLTFIQGLEAQRQRTQKTG